LKQRNGVGLRWGRGGFDNCKIIRRGGDRDKLSRRENIGGGSDKVIGRQTVDSLLARP
jgi:hypothetical protein